MIQTLNKDVTYPKHLHESHNDLPFLPKNENQKCQ